MKEICDSKKKIMHMDQRLNQIQERSSKICDDIEAINNELLQKSQAAEELYGERVLPSK